MHLPCAPILFCTLLLAASCQKIDADDIPSSGSDNETNTPSGSADGSATDPENNSDTTGKLSLRQQPDGSLLLPTDQHVIALSSPIDDNTDKAILISLYEWQGIASAYSDINSAQAVEIAGKYKEGTVAGWRIPTKDEGKKLRELYYGYDVDGVDCLSDSLQSFNTRLTSLGGWELRAWQLKDGHPAYRYLCEDGTYSFSLLLASNTTKAGTKTKYNLRLVKDTLITKP